jgi:ATP-dependent Lon protease
MRLVIIPEQNKKDLEDIPAEILKKIKIVAVSEVEDALKLALEKYPPSAPSAVGKKSAKRLSKTAAPTGKAGSRTKIAAGA